MQYNTVRQIPLFYGANCLSKEFSQKKMEACPKIPKLVTKSIIEHSKLDRPIRNPASTVDMAGQATARHTSGACGVGPPPVRAPARALRDQPVRLAGSFRCWFVKKYCWLVCVREKYYSD